MSRWTTALLLTLAATVSVAQEKNPERNAYFAETHLHTSWSFDAYVFGNIKAGPDDAYKCAMGQPIPHPAGYQVKINRPLDFMAVTDPTEYVGVVSLANGPNSGIFKVPMGGEAEGPEQEEHP